MVSDMDLDLTPINVLTLKETVYKRLLQAIVSGKLPPGTRITIAQLAGQLGVSLMPVREALRKLEAGSFISIQKNRRIVIKELSRSDLNELLQIRLKLESMAARAALKNYTNELLKDLEDLMDDVKGAKDPEEFLEKNKQFHHTLYRHAHMPILQETIEGLWRRVSPYLHIYVSEMPDYKVLKIHYHEGILEGVREKDPNKVCKWLSLDLKKAAALITGLLDAKGKKVRKYRRGAEKTRY
jgi:DNA-binding GntR family transcriptional regulator